MTFAGDVFLTRANGASTEAVGEFDLQFGRNGGQPALSLNMSSPSLSLSDFLLVRFSYAESDALGALAAAQVRTWFGTPTDGADQNGTSWLFGQDRTLVGGQETVDVLDADGASGFAAVVQTETITTYVVFFPAGADRTVTFDYDVLNGRGGQGVRLLMDDQGNAVGPVNTFSSAVVAADDLSSKSSLQPVSTARRAEILAAFAQYLETMGR